MFFPVLLHNFFFSLIIVISIITKLSIRNLGSNSKPVANNLKHHIIMGKAYISLSSNLLVCKLRGLARNAYEVRS